MRVVGELAISKQNIFVQIKKYFRDKINVEM